MATLIFTDREVMARCLCTGDAASSKRMSEVLSITQKTMAATMENLGTVGKRFSGELPILTADDFRWISTRSPFSQ
ncbi:hypothetical protein [Hymenobacter nivis]|uniref:Uncharacterized protein n=1 Tax=Hymenobacter nivis TaxID=1850093 RepID=A0A502GF63_9BACT|nr:hypothetical protein [Hymenobacter nivis]TPG60178.1 hypothetical protein EAH73_20865 [Hymenobacter nivis]